MTSADAKAMLVLLRKNVLPPDRCRRSSDCVAVLDLSWLGSVSLQTPETPSDGNSHHDGTLPGGG